MKLLYLILGVLSLIGFEVSALKLYLVSNHDNAGDHNQALGIAAAFQELSSGKISIEDLNIKTIGSLHIKEKIEKALAQEKVIFVGTGEGGIEGVKVLPRHSQLVICLTSHMPLEAHRDKRIRDKVDFIALPLHVTADLKSVFGSKLIETIGVAHNRRPDGTTYVRWRQELPPAEMYIGVYLGGDAPTQTKELKLFSEKDAERLANYVVEKMNELESRGVKASVLVLNGPRTGKYDAEKKELPTVHREGKSDRITALFERQLVMRKIPYKIFDFQHNTPENKQWVSPYNAFDLVAAAVRKTKGTMLIPGESTSVVSEAIDILPRGTILVYYNSAMNESHKAHVLSELEAGRISTLEDYHIVREPISPFEAGKPSATRIIAQRLLEAVNREK